LGSQEYYYVPCPHCNPEADDKEFMFVIRWEHIKYSETLDPRTGLPAEVYCECPNCAGKIEEALHKSWMLENGAWFSEKGSPGLRYRVDWEHDNPSFFIASFYSPYGFFSWADAVKEWFDYLKTKDLNKLQVIVNQTWAETFTMTGHEVSYSYLHKRREYYGSAKEPIDVPFGALVLTAGVDVQSDRLEALVLGFGLYDEIWAIDYSVFAGDPKQKGNRFGYLKSGQPSVWLLLDQYLSKQWQHESGQMMPIECTMVDAQYSTEEVNIFCKLRESRRIFPIHGMPGWTRPYIALASKRRHERYGTINYNAGVDSLKTKLYSQLKIKEEGPGFIHFPKKDCFSEAFMKGLTCERLVPKIVKGQKVLYWDNPPGARNEPTDLFNYGRCGFEGYPVDLQQRAQNPTPLMFARTERKPRRRKRGSKGIT